MRFKLPAVELKSNLRDSLRKAGYFGITDRLSNKESYVRRLSRIQHYPRFHLYIETAGSDYIFNLHLDQKKESYQGAKAHSADYDEQTVRDEAERILGTINQ